MLNHLKPLFFFIYFSVSQCEKKLPYYQFFFKRALGNLNFVTKQKLATKDDLSYCLNEIFEGISAFSSSLDVYSNDRKLEPMMKAITILYHRTMELRMLSGYSLEKKLFTNQKFRFTCEKSLQFWGDQLPTR